MNLIQTSAGLPNSCTFCGKKITTETWYASSVDFAIAGRGGHKKCFVEAAKEAVKELEAEAEALEAESEEEGEEVEE